MKIEDLNKQSVMKSKVLAKATFKRDDHFDIIAVHEQSTQLEYYWQYAAKSKRSPRKSWEFAKYFARDLSPLYWQDWSSFIAHYAESQKATLVYSRVSDPRGMAILFAKKETQLTPSINPSVSFPIMFKMRDTARGIYKQKYHESWWDARRKDGTLDRYLDSTSIPADEVHVFPDDCEKCGKYHRFAHYPSGKNVCADLEETKKNPALQYSHFEHGRFILRFISSDYLSRTATTVSPAPKPPLPATGAGIGVSNDLSAPKTLNLGAGE